MTSDSLPILLHSAPPSDICFKATHTPGVKAGVGNGVLTAELTGRNPGFGFAENTDDLFVGKTLLHGDVLMWLMKTLLTSGCTNQRGAGQRLSEITQGKQSVIEL